MHLTQTSNNKFRKSLLISLGALIFALTLQLKAAASPSSATISQNQIQTEFLPDIGHSSTGLMLDWRLDLDEMELQTDAKSTEISFPGFIQKNAPGELVVPEQSHLIVLPEQGNPTIEITFSATEKLNLKHPLDLAPVPSGVATNDDGVVIGGGYAQADGLNKHPSSSPIQFEEIGRMAGARLGRLTFSPIVYNRKAAQYQIVTSLKVQLSYDAEIADYSNRAASNTFTRLQSTLASQVVNPELIGISQSANTRVFNLTESVSPPRPNIILEIIEPGLYEIKHSDVVAADASSTSIDPARWQLAKHGEAVDMHWIGDGDAHFETNERFLFYAAPDANRWSKNEFYTLTALSSGTRMSIASPPTSALPTGKLIISKTFEQDANYTPNCFCGHLPAGRDGDRWIWDELRVPGNPTGTYQIDLPSADISPSSPAELTLWMIGFTNLLKDDDHALKISIGNTQLGDLVWDGKTAITHTVSIPAGVLTESSELKLSLDEAANLIDGVWLDAFSVAYTKNSAAGSQAESFLYMGQPTPHQYSINLGQAGWTIDATAVNQPQVIGSGSSFVLKDSADGVRNYVVTTDAEIKQPSMRKAIPFSSQPANLIMIGPAEFEAGLAQLIQLRTQQGWLVDFITLSEIYDSYGYGYPSPFAIQAALQDAYESSSMQPEAVILVGDGTHDPKMNQTNGKETLLPVMFADVDPWIGEIPADNRYVAIDGDDVLPDMLLGRLPVNNLEELDTVVLKLVAYPNQNSSWRENITFVADNNDNAGQFSSFVAEQFDHLNNGKHLLNSIQYSGEESDLSQVKSQIRERFAAGNSHLIYIGHSTVHQWADESLMHISEVENLSNAQRLPIILQMTCFTGSFHMAGLDSFDEALIRHETGGAVGVWGATGLSVTTGHDSLAEGYLEVLTTEDNPVVGEAIVAGKIRMMTNKPRHADLVDTYTFFGDPTLILSEPRTGTGEQNTFLPLIYKK
ncbi:MAG: C25 family cysteine peptidase [Anaerolineae bacterium]